MPGANLVNAQDPSTHATARLSQLHHGQRGVVVAIHEGRLAARLAARGLVPGAEFAVLRGGDPMLVRVDESRWALSGLEATEIEVEFTAGRLRFVRSLLDKLFR